MRIDYRKEVTESVKAEYEEYKQAELAKPVEEIFDDSLQNNFYTEINGYFENIEDDEENYRALHKEKGSIISQLWDFFLQSEYGITNYGEIGELVGDYIDKQNENEME